MHNYISNIFNLDEKIMEHILVSQIMNHLESSNLLCETQFGFRNKYSWESQLLTTIDDFGKVMENK